MPGRDGTGPLGNGLVFGRGMGYCRIFQPFPGFGRGLGFGMGFGWGIHNTFPVPQAQVLNQKELLEEQKRLLEMRLRLIGDQLENFKDDNK